MVNFVAFRTQYDLENSKYNGAWVSFGEKSELIKFFRGWESEVQALVDVRSKNSMNDEKKKREIPHAYNPNLVCRQTDAVGDPYSKASGLFREWECRSSW
jgi:hypothetical protein